jgi:hypothetical protein
MQRCALLGDLTTLKMKPFSGFASEFQHGVSESMSAPYK